MTAPAAYREDLAYIHDAGFCAHAEHAAGVLLESLQHRAGLVVELGCGSGIVAAELIEAGYDVLGYDLSAAMIELARRRAPGAELKCGSFLDVKLPPCIAVAAIGEVFNYLFDARHSARRLHALLGRVHRALVPGGVLLFDGALPGRIPAGRARSFREGDGWACLVDADEDRDRRILTRRITSFRQTGDLFRRECETHRLRLFDPQELVARLRSLGFRVRTLRRYGDLEFPPGYAAFLCRKLAGDIGC